MKSFDELALITFIACDVIVENSNNLILLYHSYYEKIKFETKDIFKRLFK